MNQTFSTNGLLNLGIILVTVLVLLFAIRSLIVPKLTDQLTASTTEVKAKRKHKKDQTLRQLLFNYNMQLVEEPSLILQVIFILVNNAGLFLLLPLLWGWDKFKYT